MNKFIARHRLPRLTQGDVGNLDSCSYLLIYFLKREKHVCVCIFQEFLLFSILLNLLLLLTIGTIIVATVISAYA